MMTRLKLALVAVVLIGSIAALSSFFHLMNEPSDRAFLAGSLGALGTFVIAPGIMALI